MATEQTVYAIIDAEGYHGDSVRVYSTHTDERQARGAKLRGGRGVRLVAGCQGHPAGSTIPRGVVQDMTASGAWKVLR